MAYGFAKTEFEPYAAEWDKKKHFPMDQYKKAADLGFGGIYVSEQYGGCGLGRLEASLIFEALATGNSINLIDLTFQDVLAHLLILAFITCALG